MKRPITVISIISILLFAVALAWFGFGIYADGKAGKEENGRVFETLVFKTMGAANTSQIGTPEFSKKFIDAVGNIEKFSSLKLEVNGKLVYSYPPAGFSLPSAALTNSFKKTNSTKSGLLLTVSASMYAIQTNSVYHYAKLAFVLILLGTSISLVLLLILSGKKESKGNEIKFFADKSEKKSKIKKLLKEKKNKKSHKKDDSDDEFNFDYGDEDPDSIFDLPDDDSDDASLNLDDGNSELDLSDLETDEESEPDLPFTTDISDGDFEIQDDENQKNDSDEKTELDWTTTLENANKNLNQDEEKTELDSNQLGSNQLGSNQQDENSEKEDSEESEKSDFSFDLDSEVEQVSPATGLKLQSELLPELDEKIKLSLESKSDLTLALLKVNGLDRGNSISNKIVEILKNEIENTDEIFEYNSDGYAIILENEDLASCADIFDKIYEKMTSYLRSSNSTNEVVVGLSSVNGRKVDSQRLETEADQALAHALEDPDSPIIAFRANPEKYREYMDN